MTKLGFVIKGSASSRSPLKRRKVRVSATQLEAAPKTVFRLANTDGNYVRRLAVIRKHRKLFYTPVAMCVKEISHLPKLKPISAVESEELSFRMLNSLEDRMKEELFDVFE
ncbi:hypothetical protein OX886_24545 [Serratia marcescens]|uniref:hypothetical protein n=1 Tax=Serratia marcescens TaxID=615 RepID=UPI0003816720|nr:hypothetical protein [Serratia marcescens]MCC7687315.1 hypothetical protein [Serratia marcescens]CAI1944965.1 Uncharacterised protein [Serratia marcescens]